MRLTSTAASKNGLSTLEASSFPRLRSQTGWYTSPPETEAFYMRLTSRQDPKSGAEATSTISSRHLLQSLTGKYSTAVGVPRVVSRTDNSLPWTEVPALLSGQTQLFLPLPFPPRPLWIMGGSSLGWTMGLLPLSTRLMARQYGE